MSLGEPIGADEVLQAVNFLALLRPDPANEVNLPTFALLRSMAPRVSTAIVRDLVKGSDCRERLIGQALAVLQGPENFVDDLVASLRDPRGISIVPCAAALVLAARRKGGRDLPESTAMLRRDMFDGEIGWAIDKARSRLGAIPDPDPDPESTGPNYSQSLDQHLLFFAWLRGEAS